MNRAMLRDFLVPLLILAGGTIFLSMTGSDIALVSRFYEAGRGWPVGDTNPWSFLYRYGIFPAYLMAFTGLSVLVAGYFTPRLQRFRRMALFFVLLLAIGPGLVVNAVFKDHWGRPRPRQIQQFGGEMQFHEVWQKGADNRGRSFPSGHASMAFYMLSPFFLLRRTSRKWSIVVLTAGIVYGLLMGTARMAQGGHFPSDVLWAGGFVYLSGLALYYLLGLDRDVCTAKTGVCSDGQ